MPRRCMDGLENLRRRLGFSTKYVFTRQDLVIADIKYTGWRVYELEPIDCFRISITCTLQYVQE